MSTVFQPVRFDPGSIVRGEVVDSLLRGLQLEEYDLHSEGCNWDNHGIILHVTPKGATTTLPKCCNHTMRKRVEWVSYRHVPWGRTSLRLKVEIIKHKCKSCGKRKEFWPESVDAHHAITTVLRKDIYQRLSERRSFTEIALDCGLSTAMVETIATKRTAELDTIPKLLPLLMGIDEIPTPLGLFIILVNLITHKPIDMFLVPKGRDEAETKKIRAEFLRGKLSRFPNCNDVFGVCIDMSKEFRSVVQEVLPNACITIDKFHLMDNLHDIFGKLRGTARSQIVRKEVTVRADQFPDTSDNRSAIEDSAKKDTGKKDTGKKMRGDLRLLRARFSGLTWTQKKAIAKYISQSPIVSEGYKFTQAVMKLFDLPVSSELASNLFADLVGALKPETEKAMGRFINNVTEWGPSIFAYFDTGITNGPTEGINSVIRDLWQRSRGMSAEQLRSVVIYGESVTECYERTRGHAPRTKQRQTDELRMKEFLEKGQIKPLPKRDYRISLLGFKPSLTLHIS